MSADAPASEAGRDANPETDTASTPAVGDAASAAIEQDPTIAPGTETAVLATEEADVADPEGGTSEVTTNTPDPTLEDPEPEPETPANPSTPETDDPADPVAPEPEDPTDPVAPEPVEPTDPITPDPEDPADPVQPEPEVPTDPVVPDPEEPTDPVTPEPEEPTGPSNPDPEDPTDPEEPTDPGTPGPGEPETPEPDPDVNEAPTGLTLTATTVAENDGGAVIGTVSATDPEGGALTYGVDDPRFEIVDGTLRLRDGVALDHEAEPSVTLTLTVTDEGGATTTETVTLTVTDVNEAPTGLTLTATTVAENDGGAVIGTVSATDPEGGALTYGVDDPRFEIVDGTLRLRDGVALDHEAEPSVTLTLTVTDEGGATTTETVTLTVTDVVIDPPVVDVMGGFVVSELADPLGSGLLGVDWLADPVTTSNSSTVDLGDGSEGAQSVGLVTLVTGEFEVPESEGGTGEPEIYTFKLSSTDVAALYIDGQPVDLEVLSLDLLVGTASIALTPGAHEVVIQHLDPVAGSHLSLEWMPPGATDFVPVPASVSGDPAGDIGVIIDIDTSDNALASAVLEEVPADWLITDGTNTLASDGGDLDLTGWDLSELRLSPPLGGDGAYMFNLVTTAISPDGEVATSETFIDVDIVTDGSGLEEIIAGLVSPVVGGLLNGADGGGDAPDSGLGDLSDGLLTEPPEPSLSPLGGGLG